MSRPPMAPSSPAECLSADLLEEVVLARSRRDFDLDYRLSQTLTGAIWRTIDGGHKWMHYFDIHDREFSRVDKAAQTLTLGVHI